VSRLAELGAAKQLILPLLMGNAFLFLLYATGMLLAAVHPSKCAMHDLLVGSRVVYRLGAKKLTLLPAAKPSGSRMHALSPS
jgi:uncharacterized RDD family membrane protein YckC